jgi:hypothetical protein
MYGAAPAHPSSAIQKLAVDTNEARGGTMSKEITHRHQGEVTGAALQKAMDGHRYERQAANPTK